MSLLLFVICYLLFGPIAQCEQKRGRALPMPVHFNKFALFGHFTGARKASQPDGQQNINRPLFLLLSSLLPRSLSLSKVPLVVVAVAVAVAFAPVSAFASVVAVRVWAPNLLSAKLQLHSWTVSALANRQANKSNNRTTTTPAGHTN